MSLADNPRYIERHIARTLVERILAEGYAVSVWDGESIAIRGSIDRIAIEAALCTTDADTLHIVSHPYVPGSPRLGWVWLVWGNGEDLISDYSDNPDTRAIVGPMTEEIAP